MYSRKRTSRISAQRERREKHPSDPEQCLTRLRSAAALTVAACMYGGTPRADAQSVWTGNGPNNAWDATPDGFQYTNWFPSSFGFPPINVPVTFGSGFASG